MAEGSGGEGGSILGVEKSLSGRRWLLRSGGERHAGSISRVHGLPEIVARVLSARGVTPESCADYLSPTLKSLMPDPSGLRDMDAAVSRAVAAVESGETIAVFADYDVDGATSAALLVRYFRSLGVSVAVHVPDRLKDGYGPTTGALLGLHEGGVTLLLTVDCGVGAHEPLTAAREAGLDVVVLDHHQVGSSLPPAVAVVNPNRPDDASGQGHLAASGVTFLFIVALNRALRLAGRFADSAEPNLMALLDLAALGAVCDVVPLTGLNRAFVSQGMKVMGRWENAGLAALAESAAVNLDQVPGAYHAGFVFGPRINAGGRVGESGLGARLLSTGSREEADGLAERLEALNRERQAIEAQVLAEASAQVAGRGDAGGMIVAAGEGWHPGVVGIVASRLTERHGCPSLVIGLDDNGVGRGSGRSLAGIDLGAAIRAALEAGLLLSGGGHAMAAGLTVASGKLAALDEFLQARVGATERALPSFLVDGLLSARGVTRDLCDLLQMGEPYGSGNPAPKFAVEGVQAVRANVVGTGHVSCFLSGPDGGRIKGIAFRCADSALGEGLLSGKPLHVAGRLSADDWQDRRGVQLRIEDAAAA